MVVYGASCIIVSAAITKVVSERRVQVANRIFLVMLGADDPNADYNSDEQIVVSANYMLPVFWPSLFTAADLYARTVEFWSGDVESYPILLTAREAALRRAIDQRRHFLTVFPPALDEVSLAAVYDDWLTLLHGIMAPYLFVDTAELWGMYEDTPQFEAFLEASVRAWEEDDAAGWDLLINQTYCLRFDPESRRVSYVASQRGDLRFDLHGYEWLRPVPWEDPGDANTSVVETPAGDGGVPPVVSTFVSYPPSVRAEVQALLSLGPLPPSTDASPHQSEQYRVLIEQLPTPVTDEEARLLLDLFGEDDYMDLAWTLLQVIETAPHCPLTEAPAADANDWLVRLWHRHQRAAELKYQLPLALDVDESQPRA